METKLDKLIENYIAMPTEEVKNEIINESKNTSRISLIYVIGELNKGIKKEQDPFKISMFESLSNSLLVELRQENIVNTKFNEDNFKLEPINEQGTKKL